MDANESEPDSSTEPDSDDERLIRETITLGIYEGHNVSFGVSREPENARAPDDFGANIFVVNADGKTSLSRESTPHIRDVISTGSIFPKGTRSASMTMDSPYSAPKKR